MNKELTPLEALNKLIEGLEDEHLGLSESEWVVESKKIIETALKDKEETIFEQDFYIGVLEHENEKMEKVLEIIKEKEVDTGSLFAMWTMKNVDDETCLKLYNNPRVIYGKPKLTQEEYDLLKEVLL